MFTTADFLNYAKWSGILTLLCGAIAFLGFIFKWGIRFRFVGITGFMGVLTGGLLALSLVPLTRSEIPGAVRYSLVYDTGSTQVVITVPPQITEDQLDATLRQAASNLYSYGRMGQGNNNLLTVRARTIIHPEPGVSKLLYLGQIRSSLANRNDDKLAIEIHKELFAQLPKPTA